MYAFFPCRITNKTKKGIFFVVVVVVQQLGCKQSNGKKSIEQERRGKNAINTAHECNFQCFYALDTNENEYDCFAVREITTFYIRQQKQHRVKTDERS